MPSESMHPEDGSASIVEVWLRHVSAQGNAPAVSGPDGPTYTYAQLHDRASAIAGWLLDQGVQPGELVALCADRGPDLVAAVFGILLAGGAYLPLDPDYPADRLRYMVEEGQARVLITQKALLDRLPEHHGPVLRLDASALDESDRSFPATDGSFEAYTIYTSGSTGRPKGIRIRHRSVVHLTRVLGDRIGFQSNAVMPAVTSLSFDASVLDLFLPLLRGAHLVMVDRDRARDGRALADVMDRVGATVFQATPSTLRLLVEAQWRPSGPFDILSCGEALPADVAAALGSVGCTVWNCYGPAEVTVCTTIARIDAPFEDIHIGTPLDAMRVHLLDSDGTEVEPGELGEIFIGGIQVGNGYRGRPELTSERFVADRWSDDPDARLYRTGDLARLRPDGNIGFAGRADYQIKIRGYRIELGEIEQVLVQHPDVRQTVLTAPGDAVSRHLVAWVVGDGDPNELRAFLAERLPAYMLPARFVFLDEFPLSPNGKIDRVNLVAPELEASSAPEDPTERWVAEQMTELLDGQPFGSDDDFLALGGHSLLVMRLLAMVGDRFGVDVPAREIFASATPANIATQIRQLEPRDRAVLEVVDRETDQPLSTTQERLWFIHRVDPSSPAYNTQVVVDLEGPVDVKALQAAVDGLVARHEALRTHFPEVDGKPVQRVGPSVSVELPWIDASEAMDLFRQPFDLRKGPILRGALVRMDEQVHQLLISVHHIVADGWSMGVMLRDLSALYAAALGEGPDPEPLAFQVLDAAVWQRKHLSDARIADLEQFWVESLKGAPSLIPLPEAGVPTEARSVDGHAHPIVLSEAATKKLAALAQRERATPFMVLAAALSAFLRAETGAVDLPVGTLVANRSHSALEPLIGFFANTVVLRLDASGSVPHAQTPSTPVIDAIIPCIRFAPFSDSPIRSGVLAITYFVEEVR